MDQSPDTTSPVVVSAGPTSETLIRSTFAALACAILILVCFVLPAEYGIDPTRIGSAIGLTDMGRLKVQLAKEEAEESSRNAVAVTTALATTTVAGERSDSTVVTLGPGETIEVKLAMLKGQRAQYSWQSDNGEIYYDLHAETLKLPRTAPHRYSEGKLGGAQGEILAVFNGVHGWYWNNESERSIKIVLKARGQFQSMMEM